LTADTLPIAPARASHTPPAIVVVIGTLMIVATLRLAEAVVLPVVIAVLATLMLGAPVRWLGRWRIHERVAAAIVVFGALGACITGVSLLVTPATEWIATAPQTMQKLETKVRKFTLPLTKLERSADRMQAVTAPAVTANAPRTVQIATPGLLAQLSKGTVGIIPKAVAVVFLTYFLLANGPLFRRKLAGLLPGRHELERREHLLGEIEVAASRFLLTVTSVNLVVGGLTALALWAVGVSSPLLWGGVAVVLNFVPYIGPVVAGAIITLAALVTVDDPAHALLAPAAYFAIHLTESNFVTPMLLGRHLPVNTVAISLGVLFFGWLWGVPGAVLAVPLTVCAKLVCDHVPALAHVGELLDT
jgi:predicted PurR-regulated permease PerM